MSREALSSPGPSDGVTPPAALHLLVIGTNHRTSSLDVRERLLGKASYASLRKAGGRTSPWSALVLLTTCNRVEVYTLTEAPRRACEAVLRALGVSEDEHLLYVLEDRDAAAHLLRVASGLDSLAEGEEQVAAQVRNAPRQRPARASARGPLADLFLHAARSASRIRRLAGVSVADASASHAAVRFLEAVVPVEDRIVALIGTGKMARIAAKSLRPRADTRSSPRRRFAPQSVDVRVGRSGSSTLGFPGTWIRAVAPSRAFTWWIWMDSRPGVSGLRHRAPTPRSSTGSGGRRSA